MDTANEKGFQRALLNKYLGQVALKLQRGEEELKSQGLLAGDFTDTVFIEHEDGSSSFFKYAFFVEGEDSYAIFTEHCGYQEFKKDWLNEILQFTRAYKEKSMTLKWASSNTAYVSLDRTDERLYLTKAELLSLHDELKEFINYYANDFTPSRLHERDEDTGNLLDGLPGAEEK